MEDLDFMNDHIKSIRDFIYEEIDAKFYTALELLDTEINRMEDETI